MNYQNLKKIIKILKKNVAELRVEHGENKILFLCVLWTHANGNTSQMLLNPRLVIHSLEQQMDLSILKKTVSYPAAWTWCSWKQVCPSLLCPSSLWDRKLVKFSLQKRPVDVILWGAGVHLRYVPGEGFLEYSNKPESQADSWAVFLIRISTAYMSWEIHSNVPWGL